MEKVLRYGGLPPKYQCTSQSKTSEAPNIALGVYCIAFGTVFIPLYILCLLALIQRDLRAIPAYKIMIFLGISDIAMLICNSFITGFFFLNGTVFCSNPVSMYIIGCISNGFWGASCLGCLSLVFTRLVDLWSHNLHESLFGGKSIYAVILLCCAYAVCFFLYPSPGAFNAKYRSWIYDPIIDESGKFFESDSSWLMAANNVLTVSSTFALYIAFLLSFLYKYILTYGYRITSQDKQMFCQSCAISGVNFALALIYVYVLYFPVPTVMTTIGLTLWQFSSAGAVIVYIGINKTVRNKILHMISKKKKKTKITTVSLASSRK